MFDFDADQFHLMLSAGKIALGGTQKVFTQQHNFGITQDKINLEETEVSIKLPHKT